MGKQTRRNRGSNATKLSRAEKLEERRKKRFEDEQLRQLEEEENSPSQNRSIGRRTIFQGDRVWFWSFDDKYPCDKSNPDTHRGIVVAISIHAESTFLEIRPLFLSETDETWRIPVEDAYLDAFPQTLEHKVGDKVICECVEDDESLVGIVEYLWPVWEKPAWPVNDKEKFLMPCYQIRATREDGSSKQVYTCQREMIKVPPTLRFCGNDEVLIDSRHAVLKKDGRPSVLHSGLDQSGQRGGNDDPWIRAIVSNVHENGIAKTTKGNLRIKPCFYECTLQNETVVLLNALDTTEYIVAANQLPRERLFEAIEEDCHASHLSYLINKFRIDVASFEGLALSKAIEFASYNMLSWIERNLSGPPLIEVCDSKGNNILHQLATKSQFIVRCLKRNKEASTSESVDERLSLFDFRYIHRSLQQQRNDDGDTWLDLLARQQNTRAVDLALSPFGEPGGISSFLYLKPEDVVRIEGITSCSIIRRILHDHQMNVHLRRLECSLTTPTESWADEACIDRIFVEKHSKTPIEKFVIRYAHEFGDIAGSMERDVCHLGAKGLVKSFKSFLTADKAAFLSSTIITRALLETQNEFVQLELYGSDFELVCEEIGFASAVALGIYDGSPMHQHFEANEIRSYLSFLRSHAWKYSSYNNTNNSNNDPIGELLDFMQREEAGNNGLEHNYVYEAKIYHLSDRPMSKERMELLSLLVFEESQQPPNALDAIRFRKCDVLRWLVANGFLSFDSSATVEKMLMTSLARRMKFLDGKRAPKTLTTAGFLCFACIEFDDLQSFDWIVGSSGLSLKDLIISGFNLLHACAFFGRLEMIIALKNRSEWDFLASQRSFRKAFDQMPATHIAVVRGHTNAADILLQFGVLDTDGRKRTSLHHAKMSKHVFVRKWGEERTGPHNIARDVEKLLQLVASRTFDSARKHLEKSRCMQVEVWRSVDLGGDDKLPNGKTYKDIFLAIMGYRDNLEFLLWFVADITIEKGSVDSYLRRCAALGEFFGDWRWYETQDIHIKNPDLSHMVKFASDTQDRDLQVWLSTIKKKKSLSITEPNTSVPFLKQNFLDAELSSLVRAKFLRLDSTFKVLKETDRELRNLFHAGAQPSQIKSLVEALKGLYAYVVMETSRPLQDFDAGFLCYKPSTGKLNIDCYVHHEAFKTNSFKTQLRLHYRRDVNQMFFVLAAEGYDDLTRLCLELGYNWTRAIELETIQTAAFLGHSSIVDIFLREDDLWNFQSSYDDRALVAVLGLAEGGHNSAFSRQVVDVDRSTLVDPILSVPDVEILTHYDRRDECLKLLSSSISASMVYGCLFHRSSGDTGNAEEIMKTMIQMSLTSVNTLLEAASLIFSHVYEFSQWRHALALFRIFCNLGLSPSTASFHKSLMNVSSMMLMCFKYLKEKEEEEALEIAEKWLSQMLDWGLDIQMLKAGDLFDKSKLRDLVLKVQEQQRECWMQFDILKDEGGVDTLKTMLGTGEVLLSSRNKGGLTWPHVAAAYDNVAALSWLVEDQAGDLTLLDYSGRTVLDVAVASQASNAKQWIIVRRSKAIISSFLSTNFRRVLALRRKQRTIRAIVKVQSLYQGFKIRKVYRVRLLSQMDSAQQFNLTWSSVIGLVENELLQPWSWTSVRDENSEIRASRDLSGTAESLQDAVLRAIQDDAVSNSHTEDDFSPELLEQEPAGDDSVFVHAIPKYTVKTKILMSSFVSKWLKHADSKYRGFFIRRLQQLQAGDRSRILAKRLKGSQSTIFETYLEQKSGHRILWTEQQGEDGILIWYVARHKTVSRLMLLIDESQTRSSRQKMPKTTFLTAPLAENHEDDGHQHVVLNPTGNVPLKIYEIRNDELEGAILNGSWTPRLYLSPEERDVVESKGTVLLLGRSGTGKTVCICNRMDMDRELYSGAAVFRQLFVARSVRLSRYVGEAVGPSPCATYTVFDDVVRSLEGQAPTIDGKNSIFLQSRKVTFSRFKTLLVHFDEAKAPLCDPMITWACIRSFIKGSIEAVMEPNRILPRNKFLELGKKRCRLPIQLRETVYTIFEKYQRYLNDQQMWDDCDRIMALLERLDLAMEDREGFADIKQSKIYVDEIQDYTQAEILLFFKLSGPGDLFLAGDPAQSVAEGVEFRFEDIRSVGFHIAQLSDRGNDLIPAKPKIVNINFRSHSGILNVAAATLRVLFRVFPDSAKQLREDRGVFTGPRPGTFHKVETERLRELVLTKLNGIVVLTRDESVSFWKKRLGGYPLVYGIRAAKGLEFKNVILLNFATELPRQLQRPWRELLIGRESAASFRELEGQLKLMYTGVTRCIEQLFIAETAKSIAGDIMIRWLTTTSTADGIDGNGNALATKNSVDSVEAMVMTSDEWLATGLENAEMAEQSESPEESASWLDKAVFCFEQARNVDLAKKARVHRSSVLYRSQLLASGALDEASSSAFTIEQEIEVAHLVEVLLKEGLRGEAVNLFEATLTFLGEVPRMKLNRLVHKLAEEEKNHSPKQLRTT